MRSLCIILILFFICLQLLSLWHHGPPGYDERASIDIALGVRPEYLLDSADHLTLGFHYESVLSKSHFIHEDYAKLRTVRNVFSGVMHDDSNGFLYYVFLQKWISAFGISMEGMRLFTLMTSWICLFLFYLILQHLFPKRLLVPYIGVALLFSNPIFFFNSLLIRSYTLALLFSLAFIWFMIKVISREKCTRHIIAFGIFCWLSIWSHYFTLALVIPCLIFLAFILFKRSRVASTRLIFVATTIALLATCGFWVYLSFPEGFGWMIKLDRTLKALPIFSAYDLSFVNMLKQLYSVFGNSFNPGVKEIPSAGLLKLTTLALLIFSIYLAIRYKSKMEAKDRTRLLSILFLSLTPIAFYAIESVLTGHLTIFISHYEIFLIPGLYVLAAESFSRFPTRKLLLVTCFIPFSMILLSNVLLTFSRIQNQLKNYKIVQDNISRIAAAIRDFPNRTSIDSISGSMSLPLYQSIAPLVDKSMDIDSITFNNYRTAQEFNYFLTRFARQQIVRPNSGDDPTEIIFYGKNHSITIRNN